MDVAVVDLEDKFGRFDDRWQPHIVGTLNDMHVKVVKLEGEFIWHHHDDEDELFLVVAGVLRMQFRDRELQVRAGQFVIVPRGVEHCPIADETVHVVLIEPASTRNTGNVRDSHTVDELDWL